jgi:hypothetical protein
MLASANNSVFDLEKELELFGLNSDADSDSDIDDEYGSDDDSYCSEDSSSGEDEDLWNQVALVKATHTPYLAGSKTGAATVAVYIQEDTTSKKASSQKGKASPHETLTALLEGLVFPQRNFTELDWNRHFLQVMEERIAAYSMELTKAVRAIDLEALKTYPPEALNACNVHGESIMNIVCRRDDTALLDYVLSQGASLHVRDDYGKTPMHEACWSRDPNFTMLKRLLKEAPELLFAQDRRGFFPLDYVPKDSWKDWNEFLTRQKPSLRLSFQYLGITDSRQRLEQNFHKLSHLLEQHCD